MDFVREYNETKSWVRKCIMMNMFHSSHKAMGHWSVHQTARCFDVSVGLVSENLRLAKEFDNKPELMRLESRQKALDAIDRRKALRYYIEDEDE